MISRHENIRSPLDVHEPQRERGSRMLTRPGFSASRAAWRSTPAAQARRASSCSQAATRGLIRVTGPGTLRTSPTRKTGLSEARGC